jgi:hypothetical protein
VSVEKPQKKVKENSETGEAETEDAPRGYRNKNIGFHAVGLLSTEKVGVAGPFNGPAQYFIDTENVSAQEKSGR